MEQDSQPNQNPNIGLTGSQIQQHKPSLPVGVYIIVAFSLVGFVISFFDSSQTSMVYTVAIFIDLLLAIGLLLRSDVARKLIIWLMGLTLVLVAASLLLLAGTQQRIQQRKADYESAIRRVDQNRLTLSQKQQLDNL